MASRDPIASRFAALVEGRLYSPDVVKVRKPLAESASRAAITRTPATPDGLVRRIREAEEIAAVSGLFDPEAITFSSSAEQRAEVLSALWPHCSSDRWQGRMGWLLKKPVRRAALRRLIQDKRLSSLVASNLPPTNGFGEMLRRLLRQGASTPLGGLTQQELLDLVSAIETIGDVPLQRPDVEAVRKRLPRTRILDEYMSVVQGNFIGRHVESEQLERFLRSGPVRKPSYAVVSGLGGAGKSALLATFACSVVEHRMASAAVILDFDRPGIGASDPYWLTLELARQVGQQYPELEHEIRDASERMRARRARSAFNQARTSSTTESFERSFSVLLREVARVLRTSGGARKPLLIILDTFEEVVQARLVPRAKDWIEQVADAMFGIPLKVVFSGRLFDSGLETVAKFAAGKPIMVDELDRDLAEQLLRDQGLNVTVAADVSRSERIPRRPLELKLVARLLLDDPSLTVKAFEESLRGRGSDASKLFAGVVYRRVLRRLRNVDPIVRKIAYPGLILRYVNADLLREVVAPALRLKKLTRREAQTAIDALARYEWLAYRDTAGNVWHRKDMRRAMLAIMMSEDEKTARELSRAAARYFRSRTGVKNDAEAMYHELLRLRADSKRIPPLEEVARAVSVIGADAADLPLAGQAMITLAAKRTLTPELVAELPTKHRVGALNELGEEYVQQRQFGNALKALERLPKGWRRRSLPFWAAETCFATATWAPLAARRTRIAPPRKSDDAWLLAVQLYPKALIAGASLEWARINVTVPHAVKRRYESGQPFERLAASGIVLSHVSRRCRLFLDALANFKPQVRRSTQMFGRRMNQLAARHGLHRPQLGIGPATILIDADWLGIARKFAGDVRTKRYLARVASRLSSFSRLSSKRRVARHLLTSIDTIVMPNRSAIAYLRLRSSVPAATRYLLARGPDPEFRDPTRFALLEAFSDEAGLRALASTLKKVIPLSLDDLEPDNFVGIVSPSAEQELVIYVELADRVGKLGDLLHAARMLRPKAKKLESVFKAWRRWDSALRTVYKQRIDPFPTGA